MDILLITPNMPLERPRYTEVMRKIQFNLGLCYIGANLEKNGFKTGIIDAFHHKISEEEIIQIIEKNKPKIVGISVLTVGLRGVYSILNKLKNLDDIEIVVGGYHITVQPQIVKYLNLKYGFIGEADKSFVDLCEYIINKKGSLNNISGLIYNDNGNLKINQYKWIDDLDVLPFPDYNLFLHPITKRLAHLSTSRGCPFKCFFCSNNIYRDTINYRSAEGVVNDIGIIINKYGYNSIAFTDDTFTLNKERVIEICRTLRKKNIKFNWGCLTRIDCLDEEILEEMVNAGLKVILLGIESGVEKIRKLINKNFSNKECLEKIDLCKKFGLEVCSFFMIGLPQEDLDDIYSTIKFSTISKSDHAYFNTFVMVPGSPAYKQLKDLNIINDNTWIDYMTGKITFPVYIPTFLTKDELEKIEIKAHRKFYITIRNIIKLIFKRDPFSYPPRHILYYLIILEAIEKEIFKPILNKIKKFSRKIFLRNKYD